MDQVYVSVYDLINQVNRSEKGCNRQEKSLMENPIYCCIMQCGQEEKRKMQMEVQQ